MADRICAPYASSMIDKVERGADDLLDNTQPMSVMAHQLHQAAVGMVRSAQQEPITIEINWPSGVSKDIRATLRAQIEYQLQLLAIDVSKAQIQMALQFAGAAGPLAIEAASNLLRSKYEALCRSGHVG